VLGRSTCPVAFPAMAVAEALFHLYACLCWVSSTDAGTYVCII
jgi:hypothetical protein